VPFQTIFQKQSSDDLDLSSSDHNKKKLAKIVVECRKEGLVNYVPPEYLKNDNKDLTKLEWEKCKLVLVKCAGGYMLEFHSLDKTPKVSARRTSRSSDSSINFPSPTFAPFRRRTAAFSVT
jgi:hypothetical protein